MSEPPPPGPAHSILDRLKNEARARHRPVAELLELYAIERLLHRLGCSHHRDQFVLKGGLLVRHWLGMEGRPTRDIDLLGPVGLSADQLRAILGDVLTLNMPGDGMSFDAGSVTIQPIRGESAGLGLRAKFDGLVGRSKIRYQIDIGLGDAVFPPAVDLVESGLLGLPIASIKAYTAYTTIAEKLEAMVVLGEANSRMKDYFDLAELPRALAFDGATLAESIRRTFERRHVPIPSEPLDGLADPFRNDPVNASRWSAFVKKNHLVTAYPDLRTVVDRIRPFAQPVLDAVRQGLPFDVSWAPGGPWR